MPMKDELDLQIRQALEVLKDVPPRDPNRARAGKMAFLDMAEQLRPETRPGFSLAEVVPFGLIRRLKEWSEIPKLFVTEVRAMPVLAAIVMIFTFLVGGAVTVRVADAAAPGDPLYVVDVATEQIQLAFTRSPEKRAQLLMRFTQERLEEIRLLEARGRYEQVPVAAERLQRHLSVLQRTAVQMPASQRTQVMQQIQQINQVSQTVLQAVPASTATPAPGTTATPEPTTTPVADATYVEFVGVVESMDGDQWVIDGQIVFVAGAEVEGTIQVGDLVKVEAWDNGDGTFTAKEIYLASADDLADASDSDIQEVEFTGTVESMDGDQWVIDGKVVIVSGAEIEHIIQVGDVVRVEAWDNGDGTYIAFEIELLSADDLADEDDMDDMDKEDVEFTGTVESMDGDQWIIDGKTVFVTGAEIEGTIQVGDLVKVEAWDNGDGTFTAKEIKLVSGDDASDDDVDDDEDKQEVEFTGTVESMNGDQWVIDGKVVIVSGAEIDGDIQVGDLVRVEAWDNGDGTFTALEVELVSSPDVDDEDTDDSYDDYQDDEDDDYDESPSHDEDDDHEEDDD